MSEKKIQTCDTCKVRHQKCDGIRPTCHHCKIRNLECVYSTYSAKPRGATALASTNAARTKRVPPSDGRSSGTSTSRDSLEVDLTLGAISENGRIEGILRKELASLDVSSSKKESLVQSIIQQLQLNARPTLTGADAPTDMNPLPLNAVSTNMLLQLIATVISGLSGEHPAAILEELPTLEDLPFVPVMVPVACGHTLVSIPVDQSPSRAEAQTWVDAFLRGPNAATPVMTIKACQDLLHRFYDMSGTLDPKELCLMTYMLAIGARYSDHVPPKTNLQWIHRAHCQLEYCLNNTKGSQLWLLQPLLLRCLLSVHTSPSTSWLILGIASRIAQLYRLDQGFETGGPLNAFEHEQWHPLWGSIVYLDVWLSVILGRLPSISTSSSRYPLLRNISSALEIPENSFRNNVARLGVLLGLILRDIYSISDPNLSMYEGYLRLLQTWADNLPFSLRFQHSDSGKAPPKDGRNMRDETGSRYLELMYLNNLMILSQPLVQARVASYAEGKPAKLDDYGFLVQTCIESAARIGFISRELGRSSVICKRAWLVSTMNYHAALVLLLFLASKEPSLPPNISSTQAQNHRHTAERGISASMQVLQFCGRVDPYANHLQEVIKVLWGKAGFSSSSSSSSTSLPSYDTSDPNSAVQMDGYLANQFMPEYGQHGPDGVNRRGMPSLDVSTLKNQPNYSDLSFSPAVGGYSTAPSSAGISQPFTNLMSQQTSQASAASGILGAADPYDLSYYNSWSNMGFHTGLPNDPNEGHDPDYQMQ